jgi:hypothetical protein
MARLKKLVAFTLRWSAYLVVVGVLAWFSLNSLLGLAGVGLLPAAALGSWLAVAKRDSSKRAWWLGWAATFGAALPTCPWWNGAIPNAAWWSSQRLSFIPWDYLELASLVLATLLPLIAVGLLGMSVGSFSRYLFRKCVAPHGTPPSDASKWRFSLRELMVTIAVFGLVLGWNMEWTRRGQNARRANQLAFLQRFKDSFTSGQVKLLAEPMMEGLHRSATWESGYRVFLPPGISEYRITAPIREAGRQKWAVWSYMCNQDNAYGGEYMFQFGYAETPSQSQLPDAPFPLKRYIQYSTDLIDGLPATAGPVATIISSPATASVNQPLVIKATAPAGTTCRLVVGPFDALASPVAEQTPDAKGGVTWSVSIAPKYAGGNLAIAVQCIQPRGPDQALMNLTPAPNIRLLSATADN